MRRDTRLPRSILVPSSRITDDVPSPSPSLGIYSFPTPGQRAIVGDPRTRPCRLPGMLTARGGHTRSTRKCCVIPPSFSTEIMAACIHVV
eukprot:scaffold49180_cov32-Tisochrysis_lutea.AAC.2